MWAKRWGVVMDCMSEDWMSEFCPLGGLGWYLPWVGRQGQPFCVRLTIVSLK